MTRHERLVENYEDALFALLMDSVAEEKGAEALRLNEELKKAPCAEVPKAVRDRCEKTIRTAFAKKKLRITGRTAARWFTKVAVIATLCGLMFMAAFAASEDIRIATLNVLIQVMDDRTEITFTGNASEGSINNHKTADREYPYHIAVDWIPSGFAFQNGQTDAAVDVVRYVGPDNGSILITFMPYKASTVYNINSEECETRSAIVQGKPATLYTTKVDMLNERFGEDSGIWSDITICWIDEMNGNIAEVSATNLTEKEVLRLADGVHWVN